ncbi:uncharacterized protein ARMOST_00064 [Armillaria ostoyae]|uniref:Uncharacterized protein n=1 Tax=Armillaria ostoyae TaxID=47428 RepID=A0A284QK29_ARMOS|nr:uncharacterized protein ARMOST_00064 [Armillaria ostoyae]
MQPAILGISFERRVHHSSPWSGEGLSKFLVYKPSGGDALVKSGHSTIYYYRGDEAFYASIDTYLVDTTWVSRMSWENNTDATQTYSLQYTTGLKVTKGDEVTGSVGIKLKFDGMSINTNMQKKYRFRDTMFFILDTWNEEWNIGSPGGYELTTKECEVEMMSEEYLTTGVALWDFAPGTMDVKRVSRADSEDLRRTRNRESKEGTFQDGRIKRSRRLSTHFHLSVLFYSVVAISGIQVFAFDFLR